MDPHRLRADGGGPGAAAGIPPAHFPAAAVCPLAAGAPAPAAALQPVHRPGERACGGGAGGPGGLCHRRAPEGSRPAAGCSAPPARGIRRPPGSGGDRPAPACGHPVCGCPGGKEPGLASDPALRLAGRGPGAGSVAPRGEPGLFQQAAEEPHPVPGGENPSLRVEGRGLSLPFRPLPSRRLPDSRGGGAAGNAAGAGAPS